MTNQLTVDEMVKDIYDRQQSMPEPLSEEQIRGIAQEVLMTALEDQDGTFIRKFQASLTDEPDFRLMGSKFARYKLRLEDIEFLYDLQVALRNFNPQKFRGPSETLTNAFEAISKAYYVDPEKLREIDEKLVDEEFKRRVKIRDLFGRDRELAKRGAWEETRAYQQAMANIRAMDTAESGYGSQLVGVQYVGELWDGAAIESRIFGLLNTFEMMAPTTYLPVMADVPEMLFVSESTASNSSNYTTSKSGSQRVQVDAKKFVIHQMWSGEMEEDSIIPYIPFLRMSAQKSISHYSDSLVLNGDTTNAATGNINLDDADPADTKHYMAFDGIRKVGLVDNTNNQEDLSAAAITLAALIKPRERMVDATYLNDWGNPTNQQDFVQIADPTTALRISQLDEVVNWKINQARAFAPGQVAEIMGGPVIGSVAASKTEADGKVSTTGGNNTLGQVTSFNVNAFVIGWLRRVKTTVEMLPATDQTRIVYSLRLGMGRYSPTGAAAGIEGADVVYNIDLS